MLPIPMTFMLIKVITITLPASNLSNFHTSGNLWYVYTWISVCMASHFNRLFETEGLLKVKGSFLHCESGNILEVMQNRLCCYK